MMSNAIIRFYMFYDAKCEVQTIVSSDNESRRIECFHKQSFFDVFYGAQFEIQPIGY